MTANALPPAELTVSAMLQVLDDAGYGADVEIVGHQLRSQGTDSPPWEWVVEALYRFEGDSDPADESIVLAVRHAKSGVRGSLVSAFGPAGSADEDYVLQRLLDARETR